MFCRAKGARIPLPLICNLTKSSSPFSRSTISTLTTTASVISRAGAGRIGLSQDLNAAVGEDIEDVDLLLALAGLEDLVQLIDRDIRMDFQVIIDTPFLESKEPFPERGFCLFLEGYIN